MAHNANGGERSTSPCGPPHPRGDGPRTHTHTPTPTHTKGEVGGDEGAEHSAHSPTRGPRGSREPRTGLGGAPGGQGEWQRETWAAFTAWFSPEAGFKAGDCLKIIIIIKKNQTRFTDIYIKIPKRTRTLLHTADIRCTMGPSAPPERSTAAVPAALSSAPRRGGGKSRSANTERETGKRRTVTRGQETAGNSASKRRGSRGTAPSQKFSAKGTGVARSRFSREAVATIPRRGVLGSFFVLVIIA